MLKPKIDPKIGFIWAFIWDLSKPLIFMRFRPMMNVQNKYAIFFYSKIRFMLLRALMRRCIWMVGIGSCQHDFTSMLIKAILFHVIERPIQFARAVNIHSVFARRTIQYLHATYSLNSYIYSVRLLENPSRGAHIEFIWPENPACNIT